MQTLKTYRVIIRRTIEVAVEIDSVSKASLDRDMKTCQERFDTGANDELMDLFHRGVDKHLRYDELKVKGSEPVAGEAQDTVDLWESLTEVTRDEHLVYAIDAALNQEKTQ